MPEKNSMELWNQVCETDPALTKRVDTRGGFTSVCAQAQVKRATELWGPYGDKWGTRALHWNCLVSGEVIVGVSLTTDFYYPGGEFPIASDMTYKPSDDTHKKLLTDVTTKALSKLGFNSDLFEGKFDDNKYVADMKEKYRKEVEPVSETTAPIPPTDSEEDFF